LRTHDALELALKNYATASARGDEGLQLNRRGGLERTITGLVSLLRQRWGLTRYPNKSASFPDEASPPSEATVGAWESKVIESSTVRGTLSAIAQKLPRSVPPERLGKLPRNCSASHSMPSGGDEFLIDRVSAISMTARPDGMVARREAIQVLRHSTARRMSNYLADCEAKVLIRHIERTRSVWFCDDPRYIDEFVRGRLDPTNVSKHEAWPRDDREGALVQLHMQLAARDVEGIRALVRERDASGSFITLSERLSERLEISKAARAETIRKTFLDPDTVVGELWTLASSARSGSKDRRSHMLRTFLDTREKMQQFLGNFNSESVEAVILADQAAGHSMLELKQADMLSELNLLREFTTSSEMRLYQRAFAMRDTAQMWAKQDDGLAHSIETANTMLAAVRESESVVDLAPRTRLESYEQLYLNNAGAASRVLEGIICNMPAEEHMRREDHVYEKWMSAARGYSDKCMDTLMLLDDSSHPLPAGRYDDGHVSSQAWHAQPRIIALRTIVLCALVEVLLPHRREAILLHRLNAVDKAYRDVISNTAIGPGNSTTLVQNAVLVAIMLKGVLPSVPHPGPVLRVVPFLAHVDDSDRETIADVVWADNDEWIARAADHLRKREYDGGPLSKMNPNCFAARQIDAQLPGVWSKWLRYWSTDRVSLVQKAP
jgi:hypothetical protein